MEALHMTYVEQPDGYRRPFSVPEGFDLVLDPAAPYSGRVLITHPSWEFFVTVHAYKDFVRNLRLAEEIANRISSPGPASLPVTEKG